MAHHRLSALCAAFNGKTDSTGQTPLLDPWGNHAVACLSANSTRHHCHSQLQNAAKHLAKLTSMEYKHEPATSKVLLDRLTPEQCRHTFSKKASEKSRKRGAAIHATATELRATTDEDQRKILRARLHSLCVECTDGKGLRLDAWLPDDHRTEMLIDFSSIHPTKASGFNANRNWFAAEYEAEQAAVLTGAPNKMMGLPSHSLQTAIKGKCTKYSLLTTIAKSQHADGLRPTRPEFHACVITHLGEMSSSFYFLIERYDAGLRCPVEEKGRQREVVACPCNKFRSGASVPSPPEGAINDPRRL